MSASEYITVHFIGNFNTEHELVSELVHQHLLQRAKIQLLPALMKDTSKQQAKPRDPQDADNPLNGL